MSKIKIVGHASGTGVLTIAAPNTNTDRTITIPDVTGTLLDSGSDLPAANLTGTIAMARLSGTLPALDGSALTNLPATDISGKLNLSGGTMTGNISMATNEIDWGDDGRARFGASQDLQIYHDSNRSWIQDVGTSSLIIDTDGPEVDINSGGNAKFMGRFIKDAEVSLYHNGTKKLETTAEGILVTGSVPTIKIKGTVNDSATSGKLSFRENDNTNGFDLRYDGSANNFIIDSNNVSNIVQITRTTGYVGIGSAPSSSVRCKIDGAAVAGHSALQLNNHSYYSPYALVIYNADGVNRAGHEVNFNRAGSTVGGISTSTSATSFNTSSDYRLKENVDYTWDATTRLKQLKPARFNFIADDTNTLVDGFIAHEVSSVVPEAISGTKDAMTAEVLYVEGDELPEGKVVGDVKTVAAIDPQGIDQSKLVPLLVKTIQELEARITALEA